VKTIFASHHDSLILFGCDRNELFQNTMAEVTQIGETTARSGKVVARVETEMVRLKFISLRLFLYFALFALLKKK
jgi:hypothetical protein